MGHIGQEPTLRYTTNGKAQLTFSLATSYNRKNPDGTWGDEITDWHNIVLWGDSAERLSQRLDKGSLVVVEGRISNRSWVDDQGTKHYRTEIVADRVLPTAKSGGSSAEASAGAPGDYGDLPFE
jgi:single-strand DNA-binding protein